MHAAAAARSLSCAEVLLRHSVDAAAMSSDSSRSARVRELEPEEFDKFALLLLSCGATIKYSAMSDRYYGQLARAMQQHTDRLQHLSSSRARVAAVHAAASWQQCDSSSASASSSQGDSSTVKVRLMHAVTQERGSKLYTVDTKLLAQLHASAVAAATSAAAAAKSCSGMINLDGNSSSSSSSSSSGAVVIAVQESVLMKMIVPPEGWQSTVENGVKLISYDGVAFSEQGFDSMMEYLYTGAVQGVTVGQLDIDRLQAALQAAEFFHLDALAQDAQHWATLCGVVIDTATS
eukprot:7073-Heterococcus_DN1.PRE.1